MSGTKVRVNTLKVTFGRGSTEPTDAEMFQFCREQQLKPEEIYSVHKDRESGAIFVKFKSENLMRAAMQSMQPELEFNYSNGTFTEVSISEADNSFKYVRVFNLPPEIDDKEIYQAMSQYGVIRQQVREKYHQDTGFPVFSTVRGLYMEICKEIPPQIRIRHFQARIYHDGLVNKCFICRSPDHVKMNCPKKAAKVIKTPAQGRLYSDVAGGNSLLPRFIKSLDKDATNMTVLRKSTSGTQSDGCGSSTETPEPVVEGMDTEQAEDPTTSPSDLVVPSGGQPPLEILPPKQPAVVITAKEDESSKKQAEGLTVSPSNLKTSGEETPFAVPRKPNENPDLSQDDEADGEWEKQRRKGRPKKREESSSPDTDAGSSLLRAQSRRSRSRSKRREPKGGSVPATSSTSQQ